MEYSVYPESDNLFGKKARKKRKAKQSLKRQFGSIKKAKKSYGFSRSQIIQATAYLKDKNLPVTNENIKLALDAIESSKKGVVKKIGRGLFSAATAAPRAVGQLVTKKSKRKPYKFIDTRTPVGKQYKQAIKGSALVAGASLAGGAAKRGIQKRATSGRVISRKPKYRRRSSGSDLTTKKSFKNIFKRDKKPISSIMKKKSSPKGRGIFKGRRKSAVERKRILKNIVPASSKGRGKGLVKKFISEKVADPFTKLIPLKNVMADGLKAKGFAASKNEPVAQLSNKFYNRLVVPSKSNFWSHYDLDETDSVDDTVKQAIVKGILEYIAISRLNKQKGTASGLEKKIADGAERVEQRLEEKVREEAAQETGQNILFNPKVQIGIAVVFALLIVVAVTLSRK